jgi:hypothetical protein
MSLAEGVKLETARFWFAYTQKAPRGLCPLPRCPARLYVRKGPSRDTLCQFIFYRAMRVGPSSADSRAGLRCTW